MFIENTHGMVFGTHRAYFIVVWWIEKMEVPMEEREIDRIMERARMREQRRHSEL